MLSISIQRCRFLYNGGQVGWGGSEMKNKTHWKADWVCIGLGNLSLAKHVGTLCNISLIYWNSYCTSEGQWKRKKKRACSRQKENTPKAQYTTHDPPRVYKHARSHMTNTPFLTGQASELAYMSLYIIYLYLVKNKLHNSTNLETCFLQT